MEIEIVNSSTFEAADLANIGFNLVMNGHHVFGQLGFLREAFVA